MILLKIIIAVFILMETANVVALYFFPESKFANSMGVFNAWESSKADRETHNLVKYLVNWVAGTKLIFIFLLGILLFTADDNILILTAGALIISISSFFWRLYPQIRTMDEQDQIAPKNYSRVLWWMILGLIAAILISALVALFA